MRHELKCLPLEGKAMFIPYNDKEPHTEVCGPSFGRKREDERSRKAANLRVAQLRLLAWGSRTVLGLSPTPAGRTSSKVSSSVSTCPAR